ncbi:MAG: hypothetical protein MK316_12065 [Pseudomonadales bacterium]|nr:hypothetical protein [Pseudomonadales bacterium]
MTGRNTSGWLTVALLMVSVAMTGQAQESGTMRTPDGHPDISGTFTFRTLTPMQRPQQFAELETLDQETAAQFEASERIRQNRDLFDPETGAPNAGYQSRAEGGVLSYNEFWYERGIELTSDKRTSLVVDPPNGRIPYRAEYQTAARIRGLNMRNGFADHYTDRTLADRCIMGFNAGPPMVSSAYNNNVMIFQTADSVVILNEMVHNARIIPIDGRAHGEIPQWSGHSTGRWEGETLVVETKNFFRETSLGGSSKDTYLVERFRRLDPDTVMYEFTVEDDNNFTRPWTATMPLRRTDGTLFEYACHEGNIGMEGIMAGARQKNTQAVTELPD